MTDSNQITDSQDEVALSDFLRYADQVYIPVFQRPYVWKKQQLEDLCADIMLIMDEVENSQFLGAILSFNPPRQNEVAGRMVSLSLVDGQQRIMTLYVFIAALIEYLIPLDLEEAVANSKDFLFCPIRRGLATATRVVPSSNDRNQFKRILNNVFRTEEIQSRLSEEIALLPPSSGDNEGYLWKQYRRIFNFIKKHLPRDNEEKIIYIKKLISIVTTRLTFVHLLLSDASCASKIFERLNYRGIKVGIVDLIRNEIFSRSDDDENASLIFREIWQPFENRFINNSDGFFFPYCLLANSNTKQSEIFQELRRVWGDLEPSAVIDHMNPFQYAYLVVDGTLDFQENASISEAISRLVSMKRPSVCYPYLMGILIKYHQEQLSEEDAISAICAVENFLIRRAIVGFEPTGLHALFKGLINIIEDYSVSGLRNVVTQRGTIQWATDDEIKEAVRIRKFDKSKVRDFILMEYDRSLPGDDVDLHSTVEHILPQNLSSGWRDSFNEREHKELHQTLANLIPLSQPLNSSIQDSSYLIKRSRYNDESMFKTPRYVAGLYEEWTPDTIRARTEAISDWIILRWPSVN